MPIVNTNRNWNPPDSIIVELSEWGFIIILAGSEYVYAFIYSIRVFNIFKNVIVLCIPQ